MFSSLLADQLMAARYQMALSLGFHIVLSCFGVALPAMIYVLHRRGIRNDDAEALALAKKWGKASAVLVRGRSGVGHDSQFRDGPALARD